MKKILVLFFALSLFACKTKEESFRYLANKIYDPVFVAYEKGFFTKNNLNVEIIDLIAGGPTAVQAVSTGVAEACGSSYMAVINARSQGLPVVSVTDLQSAIGGQALEEFFVRKDSGITTAADLKGKCIAINLVKSSFHFSWLMALDKAGLSGEDVEFVILPFDQQEVALANGHVDAIGLMQPFVRRVKQNSRFRLLCTALDIFGEKQFTTHVINSAWAEKNQETAQRFVSGVAEAVAWIEANQEEAKVIISKYTGVVPADIDDYYFQKNAAIVIEDARYWLEYMAATGEIPAGRLTVNDFATNAYNTREGK